MAKMISVIETTIMRGTGDQHRPHRTVRQYWTLEGALLAEVDIYKDAETKDVLMKLLERGANEPLLGWAGGLLQDWDDVP